MRALLARFFATRKVGGIRFVRILRLRVSLCVVRRPALERMPQEAPP